MSKHTPGPWKYYQNSYHQTDITVFADDDGSGRVQGICRVDGIGAWKDGPETDELFEIQAANARLIAAAPCMLEALEIVAEAIKNNPEWNIPNTYEKLLKAIAKAKGE